MNYKKALKSNTLLKYGLPFLSFMVLGSFLLREFTSIRYEVYNYRRRYMGNKRRDTEEYEKSDDEEMKESSATIEDDNSDDLKKLIELGRNEEWKNIRGPRPWEDNREYKQLVEKIVNKK
ncbi:Cytochrome oxidase assembly [Dermatophagoides pteronyssinus]|uniref:Cytochrome c oxidase assembly protein COX16 homolog, mitochondrial n=1 Tax=Dermatophagoides pteronyssinus TaxID=6956 RepID=A0ABQ8JN22_DERPT|nr:Cytochrome oxidase assembly [Dermatophagoides pteronyssinus]